MDWTCFQELPGLEKSKIVVLIILGAILLVLGIVLLLRRVSDWKSAEIKKEMITVKLPLPLAVLVLGVVAWGYVYWDLSRTFPENAFRFSDRPWTLEEVKSRLERESPVRIDLDAASSSLKLTKDFSAACACQLVQSICDYYGDSLTCRRPDPLHFVISRPAPNSGKGR